MKPRCYDCLTEDVAAKVIDPAGIERWFCAVDWEAEQRFGEALMKMLRDGIPGCSCL